ncbi:head decoration protein [Rhodococcus qingshengii]|uniref:Head decoration protein n=1 Tax=Rhodococcus qingshengii TaxID=334542 RepID=A0AAW6LRU0_RHOSG|nr:head decoration protein [Rhodococcus qingshengii]MDE8648085.1 head decoration protein [Rhodococcus qingshengii]
MTNIAVRNTGRFQAENRSYVYADPGVWTRGSVTLDVSKFVAGTHYPNGFIPSGVLLGKITATGKFGPYSKDATDGRQVPAGVLWDSTTVTGTEEAAPLWMFGFIKESKLPANSGLDADAKTALAAWFKFL